jgi:hypothetical protein
MNGTAAPTSGSSGTAPQAAGPAGSESSPSATTSTKPKTSRSRSSKTSGLMSSSTPRPARRCSGQKPPGWTAISAPTPASRPTGPSCAPTSTRQIGGRQIGSVRRREGGPPAGVHPALTALLLRLDRPGIGDTDHRGIPLARPQEHRDHPPDIRSPRTRLLGPRPLRARRRVRGKPTSAGTGRPVLNRC